MRMAYTVKDILRAEVKPALGCTEPVAVALGAAAAASLLPGGRIDSIEVWVDPNTFKNGLVVSIPGTKGLSGLDLAAALGAIGGDPRLGLEVLRPVDEGVVRRARELLARGAVKIHLFAEPGLHIRTVLVGGGRRAESVIRGFHDRIVRLALDGRELRDNPLLSDSRKEDTVDSLEGWLRELSLEELLRLLGDLDEEDLEFLELGIVYNLRLAKYGLEHGPGLGVGKALERLAREGILKKDMVLQAKIITSAAADARMAGVKLPAMASAGSGNHGLTAVLPIWAVKDFIGCEHRRILEAICLSHLVTAYIKAHIGRLSAVCGCSVAAGSGAAAGVAYLMGGDLQEIASAINNLIGDLAGVICDGAKESCALKVGTAAGTAVQAALLATRGISVRPNCGLIGERVEETVEGLGLLSREGMREADPVLLRIMRARYPFVG